MGCGSTGAANDLTGATAIATRMVREFGLSKALGPVGYATENPDYLRGDSQPSVVPRPYSEQTQRIVDQEVARLLRAGEVRATDLLRAHRAALDCLAAVLVDRETVDGSVVLDVLHAETDGAVEGAPHGRPLGVS
ncbi:Cell division protein FtsH [Rhodococcus wratislaviensis]|uniref:Cell division protein FtsH n=1 Tax=Rhodococcus wratislaviensis TaxID=44752 RepID=A0A402CJG0_RHOWR|nr:hypothetical protein [Rhodococcus wratislaviensis]GCE43689.1 Cell division protein FtsH [Rhodococcus wratislaviensis]